MAKAIKVIGSGMVMVICMLLLLLVLCLQDDKEVSVPTPTYFNSTSIMKGNVSLSMRHQLLQLHRQKRYLLFPEGTSFQLVFDLIIGIVDYENYAILGVTCAVAWELPSKPPSELIENVLTRITDGTLGTVRRNGSVSEWTENREDNNRMSAIQQSLHAQRMLPSQPSQPPPPLSPPPLAYASNDQGYYTNMQRDAVASPYANANGNGNGQQQQYRQGAMSANWHARQSMAKWRQTENRPSLPPSPTPLPSQWSMDNWWERNKVRVRQNWRENQRMWSTYQKPSSRYNYTPKPRPYLQVPPKHHIYPVFGKRRRRRRRSLIVNGEQDTDPAFERLHLVEHLKSRELLFGKIERLYKTRQLNGTDCVLRALCESAQRHNQVRRKRMANKPQGFIMELLSAIFQLPHSDDDDYEMNGTLKHIISPHYLEAHQQLGNCHHIYRDCNNTFWLD